MSGTPGHLPSSRPIAPETSAGAPETDGADSQTRRPPLPLSAAELARTSVFVDFDGTISTDDTGCYLLERLASPSWREAELAYDAGRIGSRQCLETQWALLPRDERAVRAVAAEVAEDPATDRLFSALSAAGAEATIVSDGFGVTAHDLGARLGVPVVANRVDWASWRLELHEVPAGCPCAACGTCKRAPLLSARRRGRITVLVGDGTSDRHAAALADVVFAKHGLARWCSSVGLAYEPYGGLAEVIERLGC